MLTGDFFKTLQLVPSSIFVDNKEREKIGNGRRKTWREE